MCTLLPGMPDIAAKNLYVARQGLRQRICGKRGAIPRLEANDTLQEQSSRPNVRHDA